MKGPENTFIGSVHKHLPASLYSMKNHNMFNGGIADCWYSGRRDLWIEYKFIKVPARDDTSIDLITGKDPEISHLQQDWLKSRHAEGRSVGVIVGCAQGGCWFPGTAWDHAHSTKDFRLWMQTRKQLARTIELCTS